MRRLVPLLVLTLVSLTLVGTTATAQWSFYAGNHVVKDHEHFTLTLLPPTDPVPILEVRRVLANAPLAVFTSVPHGLATGDTIVLDNNYIGSGHWTVTYYLPNVVLLNGTENPGLVSAAGGTLFKTVRLTEADAVGTPKRASCRRCSGKAWTLPLPGTSPAAKVVVSAYADRCKTRFFMGYCFPDGIPTGWRVDSLQQELHLGFKSAVDLADERFVYPKVYGPTSYLASVAHGVVDTPYPTFLQTQQMSLENTATGDTISLATDDDRGLRKRLGFASDGTATGLRFLVTYIPEQGLTDPNPKGWTAPYSIRVGHFGEGIGEAIAWYRNAQIWRPGSFLRSRKLAAYLMSPTIRDCKFVIGVGASYSPTVLANGQCDVTPQYRKDMLDFFSPIHGDGMLLYHLGWYPESPNPADPIMAPILAFHQNVLNQSITLLPQVLPDQYRAITPGHAALIAEAKARELKIGSVAQTLPAHISEPSQDQAPGLARVDRDGSAGTVDLNRPLPEKPATYACYWVRDTTSVYTSLYVNSVFGNAGFDGAYLDALTPAPTCYGHQAHSHPHCMNEQLVGIDRMLFGIRYPYLRKWQRPPILINETPTDCLRTDGSAIDGINTHPDYHNVFAMTYSGAEWPRFGVVFGFNPYTYGPNGLEYLLQFSNALAMGARPIILWPEYRHPIYGPIGFPTNPMQAEMSDPVFAIFTQRLREYSDNYDTFWRDIMFGRYLEPLNPYEVAAGTMVVPPPAPEYKPDPFTTRWKLPGWKPRPGGKGCLPVRLCDKPYPTVFHGLCEPAGQTGRRCLVMVRWMDGKLADHMKLPLTHPARQTVQSVKLKLGACNLKCKSGALIRLFDLKRKRWSTLGRVPSKPCKLPFTVPIEGGCTKAIFVD